MRALSMLGVLLMGCLPSVKPAERSVPSAPTDSGNPNDTGASVNRQTHAVLATVASDYSVGALATVRLSDWTVSDTITPISGDPVVVVDGGQVIQLNRYNHDTVRVYNPGEWSAPRLEFALDDGANPHDADVCGGDLWVSLYERTELVVFDLASGLLVEAIDLGDFADSDGIPEASDLVEIDGVLYLSMQRMDRNAGWTSTTGVVAAIDCDTRTILESWETGPSPALSAWGTQKLLIRTGTYGELDGEVRGFDPLAGGPSTVVLAESSHGLDITQVVADGDSAIVLSVDADWRYTIGCLDLLTGEYTAAEDTTSYLVSVAVNDRAEAWIAARQGWADGTMNGGTIVYDVERCASLVPDDWIPTLLHPFSIGFYK